MASLVIADNNEEYASGLAAFFRSSEILPLTTVKRFTQLEHVMAYSKQVNQAEWFLLICEEWADRLEGDTLPNLCHKTVLTDVIGDDSEEKHLFYRYQSLDILASRLRKRIVPSMQINTASDQAMGAATTIAVYSAAGGSGKTVTSSNLAYHLAQRGYQVLYFNYETYPSFESMPRQEGALFSKLLYQLKNHPERFSNHLSESIIPHPLLQCDTLPTPLYMNELAEINGDEMRILLQSLKQTNAYDYVIFDLPSIWNDCLSTALQHSDEVLWLLLDEVHCRHKTVFLMQQLYHTDEAFYNDLLKKIRFVLNKALESGMRNDYMKHGLRILDQLPYIPKWKTSERFEEMLLEAAFYSRLLLMITEGPLKKGGGAGGSTAL